MYLTCACCCCCSRCCLLQMGRTPLHLACEKGHMAAAAALVAGGADLLAKDKVGSPAELQYCTLQMLFCLYIHHALV